MRRRAQEPSPHRPLAKINRAQGPNIISFVTPLLLSNSLLAYWEGERALSVSFRFLANHEVVMKKVLSEEQYFLTYAGGVIRIIIILLAIVIVRLFQDFGSRFS